MYKFNVTNRGIFSRLLLIVGLFTMSGSASALLPFEKTGNLYVSLWNTDEIAVFSPDGTVQEIFTATGLDGPRGIAFNSANGEIWVAAEHSDAIFIFDYTHQFLRTLQHEDFDEPVDVTFRTVDADAADALVYISNSDGNEIMVFNQNGELQRRFSSPDLVDPNSSAFLVDGSLAVANRLGGSTGTTGSTSKFDSQENFLFNFTAPGLSSQISVARDPNITTIDEDDTLWVTSGGGDTGIYEFDQNGNLLTTLFSEDIGDGRSIVPQGIAFDGNGDFYVTSFLNEVLKFDSDGNFIMRFATGSGTSRNIAFQGCQADITDRCVPFGVEVALIPDGDISLGGFGGSGGGGGAFSLLGIVLLATRRRKILITSETVVSKQQLN